MLGGFRATIGAVRAAKDIVAKLYQRVVNRLIGKKAGPAVAKAGAVIGAGHVAKTAYDYSRMVYHQISDSEAFELIGYNVFSEELHCRFRGKTPPYPEYVWTQVPSHFAEEFLTAGSRGKFYHYNDKFSAYRRGQSSYLRDLGL